MERWRTNRLTFWVFLVPPTFWLTAFFLIPLAIIWLYSFGEKTGIVGIAVTGTLENYWRALDPLYLQIFLKSLLMAGATTVICLVVGFPVAFAISFAPGRWKAFLLLLVILPFWTNLLIRTYALIAVLRQQGMMNFAFAWVWDGASATSEAVGLGGFGPYKPLELLYNNFAVVFGLVYVHLPFMVLPLYAALEKLDRSMIEASLDLGGTQFQTFRTVVVPLALPGIISGIILVLIPTMGSFLTPDLLGGPDSQMIANVIERQFKSANDYPFGSALSFIIMYLMFIALALRAFLTRGRVNSV